MGLNSVRTQALTAQVHSKGSPYVHATRFARETLRTSGNAATTLASADTVFVYDYCYLMRVLADQRASEHWWVKDRYKPEEDYAAVLLQLYRCISRRSL